jgi:hypothetical protein
MLGDISRAEHIYVACGYTDMRKSIDGLASLVKQRFKLAHIRTVFSCFADDAAIESRHCTGKTTALYCCTRDLKMGVINGRGKKRKQD